MTAVGKGSSGDAMRFTKDEATAAERTWLFHLCLTADQSDGTGLVPVVTISKAGGAFGAAAGAVTELTNGWYKYVFAAADVDTIGALGTRVAVATADTLNVVHQVVKADDNSAIATQLVAGGLATAAQVDAITLATRTVTKALGTVTNADGASSALNAAGAKVATSTLDVLDVTFQISGTWGGASAKVQTTSDPSAAVPVWTDYVDALSANPLTGNGQVVVAGGGHVAARVLTSSKSGTTSLTVTAVIRKPANA